MLHKFTLLFVFNTLLFTAYGQKEYAHTLLDSLCHERYDGRGYVNKGDVRSGDFIARELKKLGVQPIKNKGYEQHYNFNVNSFPEQMKVKVGEKELTPGVDFMIDPNSGSAKGEFRIVEVNRRNYKDVLQKNKLNKVLENAAVVLCFNFVGDTLVDEVAEFKQVALSITTVAPVVWLSDAMTIYSVGRNEFKFPFIHMLAKDYDPKSVIELDIKNVYHHNYESKNIIGIIPGKKKKKYVCFTAHYDHLGRMGADTYFPGGNDNASGVAMLLSLAKYYNEHPPEYSIVFCFFSGEEAGLLGSKFFVENPWIKLKKIQFVLNVDIMGSASKGITVVNGKKHQTYFDTLVELNAKNEYLPLVKARGATANSDHHFFDTHGVNAFFIYSMGDNKNYHNVEDNAANASLDNFDEVQQLLVDFVTSL